VGQYAREILFDDKRAIDNFYTEQRFISDEFQVGLNTAIALGIEKNGLYDQQENLRIHVIVALPHACRNAYAPTIIGSATGTHQFSLRCGQGELKFFRYTIRDGDVYTVSQTIAAILGETSDDEGDLDEDKFYYLSNGPTLVLDGGYYTMGMVVVSRGGSVDEAKTESNTSFAMANVNALVAEAVRSKRPDIHHYAVEYLLSKDEGTIRYMEDGRAATIDLKKIREEKLAEVCSDLIGYLNQKYDNLLDFRYVLATGGTGASFYEQMLTHYKAANLLDAEHFMLTSGLLYGEKHPIEFAIAVGAFKGLKGLAAE
jgi:hypothetical protein